LHSDPAEKNAVVNPKDDRPWFVAVAASTGGISALETVLAGLPSDTCRGCRRSAVLPPDAIAPNLVAIVAEQSIGGAAALT